MEHPAQILKQLEGQARKRFGQHFLASSATVEQIVRLSQVGEGSRVLEIGPGLGVLTAALLAAGAQVTAVELDRDLVGYLRERFPALTLVEGDAARQDWSALLPGTGWRCVANLPYNVGTALVTRMVTLPDTFDRLVVMVQREVAERMVAPAGDRARGSLSVHIQAHALAHLAIRVKPGSFHPPPKVDSAVVELRLRRTPLRGGAEAGQFERVVRAAFSTPRKTIHNALKTAFDKAEIDAALAEAGIDPGVRAGVVEVDAFGRLARALENSPGIVDGR